MSFSAEEKDRYNRHFILEGFGEEAQLKLKDSRVLVVGAGGLGCPALLYLAAAGIGHIGIADHDRVSLSNLQRQVLYSTEDVGSAKAKIAAEKISKLNPHIQCTPVTEKIDARNALHVLNEYDVILDGTDNFATRYLLNDACVILKKPLVYGAIFRFEGQVSVFNLGDGPTYRCLFPKMPLEELSCSEVGVLGVLPGIVGTWQAAEVIKIVTGIGKPLSGSLLSFDLLNNRQTIFRIQAVAAHKQITELGMYAEACNQAANEINADTLRLWISEKEVQLIDVREQEEYQTFNIGGKNIPLSQLGKNMNDINPSKITVVYCQSGVRSKQAMQLIQAYYPSMALFNLAGGLNNFKK